MVKVLFTWSTQLDSSQPPVTPAPGDPTPSAGLQWHPRTSGTNRETLSYAYEKQNKPFFFLKKAIEGLTLILSYDQVSFIIKYFVYHVFYFTFIVAITKKCQISSTCNRKAAACLPLKYIFILSRETDYPKFK